MSNADPHVKQPFTRQLPGRRFFAITPSDSVNFTNIPKAIYVGGGAPGDIVAVGDDGAAVTFKSVPVGTTLLISPIRINATGTTATNLVGITDPADP